MHRSRLPLLVIAIVAAACSRHDDSAGGKNLAQDSALAGHIATSQNTNEKTDKVSVPNACRPVAIPDQPAAAARAEAADLARKAYNAEMLGNLRDARQLLRRASELDRTDKSSAYHLGRVSEALGERIDAIEAYCRFMALAPSRTERLDAGQRVEHLAQAHTHVAVAAGIVVDSAPMRRTARNAILRRGTRRSATANSRTATRNPIERSAPAPTKPATVSPGVVETADTVADGVTMQPAPGIDQPTVGSGTERRNANTARTVSIGAVAGAIVGGAAGRSVKSAAIGAAAGGILGAVAARTTRPPVRGIRS